MWNRGVSVSRGFWLGVKGERGEEGDGEGVGRDIKKGRGFWGIDGYITYTILE